MINRMEKESSFGMMELDTTVNLSRINSMEMVFLIGIKMELNMMENGMKEKKVEMENYF